MCGHWLARALQILIVLLIAIAGFGQAVLQLWNHLMPQIFGLPALTFWQAVGLMALCWILFGSWRGSRALGGWRGRGSSLTPEQRDQLRRGLAGQSGTPPQPAL
jgi:hypothetical protein